MIRLRKLLHRLDRSSIIATLAVLALARIVMTALVIGLGFTTSRPDAGIWR